MKQKGFLIGRHSNIYSLVVLLLLWFALSTILNVPYIPGPLETLKYTYSHLGLLLLHVGASLMRISIAFLPLLMLFFGLGNLSKIISVLFFAENFSATYGIGC